MPTASIDTFIACSLMVLLVLTAMANTSKLLYPYVDGNGMASVTEKYREISKYILLNSGIPANWGENAETIPENFGLASDDLGTVFDLDVDKVSRLNSENAYALSYAQAFSALGMPDVSFKLEIKPIFDIAVNLTATYPSADETTYQFRIITEKNGAPIAAELNYYIIAKEHVAAGFKTAENGEIQLNITISSSIEGPVLLVAFARAKSNAKIVSFEAYPFAHNSPEPQYKNAFLRLNPINHSLSVVFLNQEISFLEAYAFTPDYYAVLTPTLNGNNSVTYAIPQFVSASPTILVVSGLNTTTFFIEWTAYPQLPLQFGADFQNRDTLSDVFAYTYIVTINSALYSCTVWLGGPKS